MAKPFLMLATALGTALAWFFARTFFTAFNLTASNDLEQFFIDYIPTFILLAGGLAIIFEALPSGTLSRLRN